MYEPQCQPYFVEVNELTATSKLKISRALLIFVALVGWLVVLYVTAILTVEHLKFEQFVY